MPDLPLLSQTDVTIQNNTTGQVDFLKYQGSTLVASNLKDYGLGSDWKIVAWDNGSNGHPGLVAQSQSTGFVDFLTLDTSANLIGSALSNVPVPPIFGVVPDNATWFGSQLANGQLDFLQFNLSTGQLIASDLVANTVGIPTAEAIFSWNQAPGPPAWQGLDGGLNGDIVLTQTSGGQVDVLGFSGSLAAKNLSFDTSFLTHASVPPIGEANPDLFIAENLQDTPGSPQGLEVVAQTATGQLDLAWYDTGLGDPVVSNKGILYATNLLDTFPSWHVVEGGFVAHNDLFPIS
jgi:hypothetical protein